MGLWGDVVFAQVVPNGTSGSLINTATNGNGWTYAAMLVVAVGVIGTLSKMLLSRADQRTQDWKTIAETEKENARRSQDIADKALENAEAQLLREKAQMERDKSQVDRDQVLLKIFDTFRQSPGELSK